MSQFASKLQCRRPTLYPSFQLRWGTIECIRPNRARDSPMFQSCVSLIPLKDVQATNGVLCQQPRSGDPVALA